MADRVVENSDVEVPEIPEVLESAMLYALGEARDKMLSGEGVVPFTALIVKDNLFIETHPGESAEECFNSARHTVQNARGATGYVLCYDGYIEIDDGVRDAVIAEGGMPGEDAGYAAGYLYEQGEDGELVFEEEAAYIGEAPNFMIGLKDPEDYKEDELNVADADEEEIDEAAAEGDPEAPAGDEASAEADAPGIPEEDA